MIRINKDIHFILIKMKYYIQNVIFLSLLTIYSEGNDSNGEDSETQCKCVPSNLCADDDPASTGAGLLDIRLEIGVCTNYFETCCKNIIQNPTNLGVDYSTYKGCGYSNIMPLPVSSRIAYPRVRQKRVLQNSADFIARITDQSTIAQYGELPWSSIILTRDADIAQTNFYKCGGSLIHPHVVLTAAHCILGIDPTYISVRVGEWNTRTQDEPLPYQDLQVYDIAIHPKFHSASLKNDIGLLFLKNPAELSANVGIICLTPPNLQLETTKCIGSGWGKNAFKHGKHSSILKKVDLPLVEQEKCVQSLRQTRLGPSYNLDQSFICAGGEKGKDTCKGDGDDARMKNFTSCFKEKKFLRFFFKQLRLNNTGRYPEFPYVSLCGKERNFVRCDDYPIVFTHVIKKQTEGTEEFQLAHNHADDLLTMKFQPDKVFMLPETGRVYHPAPEKVGAIGLIRSKLAIEFSKHFGFDNGESHPPTHFTFQNVNYELDSKWFMDIKKK